MIPSFTYKACGLVFRVGAAHRTIAQNQVVLEVTNIEEYVRATLTVEEAQLLAYALLTQARSETI